MRTNKLNEYNNIMNVLQANDINGTWKETLKECDNDLKEAIYMTKLALNRILSELEEIGDYETKEYKFYNIQLKKLEVIENEN